VVHHLENLGLTHHVEPENLAVTFRIRGNSGANFRCVGFLNESMDLFQFAVIFSDQVPVKRRNAVALAITRANLGMKLGFFELDFDDGELRVHAASAFSPGHLPESVVAWCISTAIAIADRYFSAIQSVCWGGQDPDTAVFEAEHPEAALLYDDSDPEPNPGEQGSTGDGDSSVEPDSGGTA
jgi:hypothetical protein